MARLLTRYAGSAAPVGSGREGFLGGGHDAGNGLLYHAPYHEVGNVGHLWGGQILTDKW